MTNNKATRWIHKLGLLLVGLVLLQSRAIAQDEDFWQLTNQRTLAVSEMQVANDLPMPIYSTVKFENAMTGRYQWYFGMAKNAKAERLILIVNPEDHQHDQPFAVLDLGDLPDDEAEVRIRRTRLEDNQQLRKHHGLWVIGTEGLHQRLDAIKEKPADALLQAWTHCPAGTWRQIFRLDDDLRFALKDLIDWTPHNLADSFQWATWRIDSQAEIEFQLSVQMSDTETAKAFATQLQAGLAALQTLPTDSTSRITGADQMVLASWQALLKQPKISVDDRQVVCIGTGDTATKRSLLSMMAAGPSAQKFKEVGLAFHNYYDTHNQFPNVFAEGQQRTLLGWRVALLPYLGEEELYDQFHHDEPWDSAHNKTLIKEMPEVFYVPSGKWKREDGRSCLQAPAGPGRMFFASKITFGMLTDGSSNTLMLVESNDEAAQIWTQPGGLEVPQKDPASFLGGHFGKWVLAARADGSVEFFATDLPHWEALLTPAGGEVSE